MSSSGPSKENPLADSINLYIRELKMHLKKLSLKDGELQIKDVQGPKGEGNLEARMEALEQEVFKYKKMAEREVDICNIPKFQKIKFSSCIHGILHFKIFSKVLNHIPS
jgi:hypothetical protein